jgi:hypothetical protein
LLGQPPLLDVTLRRDDITRHWTIAPWSTGWRFQFSTAGEVTVGGCLTLQQAEARLREWEAEIVVARADGWS